VIRGERERGRRVKKTNQKVSWPFLPPFTSPWRKRNHKALVTKKRRKDPGTGVALLPPRI